MVSRLWRRGLGFSMLIALGVALAACGGDDGGGTGFSTEVVAHKVAVAADPTGALRWDKATYEATAGDITFVVTNPSVIEHNFGIKGGPDRLNVVSKNFKGRSENTFTLKDLKPGEYQIVCTVPGHNAMVAKLIVR